MSRDVDLMAVATGCELENGKGKSLCRVFISAIVYHGNCLLLFFFIATHDSRCGGLSMGIFYGTEGAGPQTCCLHSCYRNSMSSQGARRDSRELFFLLSAWSSTLPSSARRLRVSSYKTHSASCTPRRTTGSTLEKRPSGSSHRISSTISLLCVCLLIVASRIPGVHLFCSSPTPAPLAIRSHSRSRRRGTSLFEQFFCPPCTEQV